MGCQGPRKRFLISTKLLSDQKRIFNIYRMTTVDPCKKFACKLQQCLKDNVYQPSRCESVIEEIRQCCIHHSAVSVVCDGIDTSKPYEHNTVDYKKAQK
ncbi:cx9C motif-containing protein 4 isoform X1 [Osmia lignaria lignaria]|uniref:cx9C motif-containing protein 4 isoform X1 n=2 Tax=Osmia TaxID=124287 RepID=UPI00147872F6|nr:cx9C motif-containing protein 4 isoform X1 [Osmia lignaria]